MDENKQEQMVSIIVPVYNAEAYLPEMIESVIFQNYNNWELLLIDNCSMDNSFEICQSYEKKDVRIRVMQETEKGPAAVRNHGLLAAHGGYIMFLDADDFLADNAVLDRFVNVMKHEEADIVVGNYERLWNGRRFAAASHTSFSELNPDSEDFRFQGFFSVGTLSYVWGKLYRKQFLEKTKLFLRIYLTQKINFLIFSAIYAIRNMLLSRRQDIFIEKMMTPFHLLIGRIPWNAGWQLHIDYKSS